MGFPRRLIFLAGTALLAACSGMDVPPGPPAFRHGYEDGCRSAWAVAGVRGTDDNIQDDKMKNNTDYQTGWGRGYGECFNVNQSPWRGRDSGSG
jgi:hypothetical protein